MGKVQLFFTMALPVVARGVAFEESAGAPRADAAMVMRMLAAIFILNLDGEFQEWRSQKTFRGRDVGGLKAGTPCIEGGLCFVELERNGPFYIRETVTVGPARAMLASPLRSSYVQTT